MESFSEFAFSAALQSKIDKLGWTKPTPVQAGAIPFILAGEDVMGSAQTGTGKTGAFLLPVMEKLMADKTAKVLVLVPTRELAQQVADVAKSLDTSIGSVILVGGASFGLQLRDLRRNPRILVATPGRLIDHLRQNTVKLDEVKFLVLDEADRMLDMGFAPQLKVILQDMPGERQTMLFSATFPREIQEITRRYLKNPKNVSIGPVSTAAPKISQTAIDVKSDMKGELLTNELNSRLGSALVFARTKSRVDRVVRNLESLGFKVSGIHGGKSQGQRNRALLNFREGKVRILVATDIAARGLDIDHVATVYNFDLPMDPEDYIHRIGRTGRAGRTGEAVSFIAPEEKFTWKGIERLLQGKERAAGASSRFSQNAHRGGEAYAANIGAGGSSQGGNRGNGPRASSGAFGSGPRRERSSGGPRRERPQRFGERKPFSAGAGFKRRDESGEGRPPRREREGGDDSFSSASAEGGEKKRIFGKKSFGSKKSFSGPRKSSSGGGGKKWGGGSGNGGGSGSGGRKRTNERSARW